MAETIELSFGDVLRSTDRFGNYHLSVIIQLVPTVNTAEIVIKECKKVIGSIGSPEGHLECIGNWALIDVLHKLQGREKDYNFSKERWQELQAHFEEQVGVGPIVYQQPDVSRGDELI